MTLDDVPRFEYLIRAYFHQDWDEESGPEWTDVVDNFRALELEGAVQGARADIDRMLREVADDQALYDLAMVQADSYHRVDTESVRGWLTAVRDRLASPT